MTLPLLRTGDGYTLLPYCRLVPGNTHADARARFGPNPRHSRDEGATARRRIGATARRCRGETAATLKRQRAYIGMTIHKQATYATLALLKRPRGDAGCCLGRVFTVLRPANRKTAGAGLKKLQLNPIG